MIQITGTLKSATIQNFDDFYIIWGCIYGDINNRFRDGDYIHTSRVVECIGDGLYKTLNSIYKVEFNN